MCGPRQTVNHTSTGKTRKTRALQNASGRAAPTAMANIYVKQNNFCKFQFDDCGRTIVTQHVEIPIAPNFRLNKPCEPKLGTRFTLTVFRHLPKLRNNDSTATVDFAEIQMLPQYSPCHRKLDQCLSCRKWIFLNIPSRQLNLKCSATSAYDFLSKHKYHNREFRATCARLALTVLWPNLCAKRPGHDKPLSASTLRLASKSQTNRQTAPPPTTVHPCSDHACRFLAKNQIILRPKHQLHESFSWACRHAGQIGNVPLHPRMAWTLKIIANRKMLNELWFQTYIRPTGDWEKSRPHVNSLSGTSALRLVSAKPRIRHLSQTGKMLRTHLLASTKNATFNFCVGPWSNRPGGGALLRVIRGHAFSMLFNGAVCHTTHQQRSHGGARLIG